MTFDTTKSHAYDKVSVTELDLYHLIMDARAEAGLDPIALSQSLSTTAGRHAADWMFNIWGEGNGFANLHNWSDAAYDSADSGTWDNMWSAPERIGTEYTADGFEISAAGYSDIEAALAGWLSSNSGHADVILNNGGWAGFDWSAIGIGVAKPVAGIASAQPIYHVWFGVDADPAGAPRVMGTGKAEVFDGTDFADNFLGRGGADTMHGGAGKDALKAGGGADSLFGGGQNDLLKGGGGRDKLYGEAGRDKLNGGGGRDALAGGEGNDVMQGKGGRDTFVFTEASFGRDKIMDAAAREKILFDVAGEAGDYTSFRDAAREVGGNVVYDLDRDGHNKIVFNGLTLTDLDKLNFDFG